MAKEFRINAKNFFLTYPQNDTEPEEALSRMENHNWPSPFKWAIVSQETHQSGDYHLHVVVAFEESIRTRCSNFFDFVCGKHPNIQDCRSVKKCVLYVAKHGRYVTSINFPTELLSEKSSKSTALAGRLIGGCSVQDVMKEDPGFFLLNKRKIEDMHAYLQRKNTKTLSPWTPIVINNQWPVPQRSIANWLNENLFQTRPYGAKDLYIFGPTGIGKTSLLIWLSQFCRIYQMPSEDFYDHYEDEDYDLVTYDEFRAGKPVEFLNQWCQAYSQPLKKKGMAAYIKKRHVPTIFVSNYSIRGNYHVMNDKDPSSLDPLERRLVQVEILSPFKFN